jgi:release factor glutamine methyltransferase
VTSWRELRNGAVVRLGEVGVIDPDQEVRWLVEAATGRPSAEQVTILDGPLDPRQAETLEELVARRVGGEPLQYVIGSWGFRTLDLLVDRRVLIPRPETEVVAGLAIEALDHRPGTPRAVDLGTGSGAIALSLAAERWPAVEVWATDASADALAVARANLAGLGRRAAVVRLLEGDWFEALPADLRGSLDLVVSNPPYVGQQEELPPDVAGWEPASALVAGPTGLEHIGRIVAEAPQWLTDDGRLVLEIGEEQGEAVTDLARAAGFTDVAVHPDLAGRPRAVVAGRA